MTTSVQQVDQQVPFAAQDFHVQKTVKYQHDSDKQASKPFRKVKISRKILHDDDKKNIFEFNAQ
jgi:hypothetical protein